MPHVSTQYDTDLKHIKSQMKKMALLVTQQFERSVHAFLEHDLGLSNKITDTDNEVNNLEMQIDNDCLQLIVKRQPTAIDLRSIMASLKIVVDLERVGDESKKIARIVRCSDEALDAKLEPYAEILRRAHKIAHQELSEAVEAFVKTDESMASDIIKRDRKLDSIYVELKRSLVGRMKKDATQASAMQDIMSAARSMERIGDHAKNIAQHVFFISEGEDIRHPFGD